MYDHDATDQFGIKQYGSKQAYRVTIGDMRLYFSYSTLVGFVDYSSSPGMLMTDKNHSKTTSSHINNCFGLDGADKVSQRTLELEALRRLSDYDTASTIIPNSFHDELDSYIESEEFLELA